MDFLYEKISYLRGLADGLDVKADTREGKLFNALLEVIEEIADGMSDIVEEQDELNEYLDLLDEDLTTDDDDYDYDYDFDDDDEYYDEDFEDECCGCGHNHDEDDDDDYQE